MNTNIAFSILAWASLISVALMAIISFIKEPPHCYIKEALKNLEWENDAED